MHLLWDCGEAASLLPPPQAQAVYKRKTQKDSARALQQVQEPADSPAQLLLSAEAPSSGFPLLSIYYYYYVQVVLHQKTPSPPLSPCSSSPTAAPQPCLFLKMFLQPRGVVESKA